MRQVLRASVLLVILASQGFGQFEFKDVQVRVAYGAAKQGNKGLLVIDGESIRFQKKGGKQYFSIPTDAVTEVFYSRVAGRRIGAVGRSGRASSEHLHFEVRVVKRLSRRWETAWVADPEAFLTARISSSHDSAG